MRPEKLKSLFHVLGEIALPHPKAVLMKGRDYWRIEHILSRARRDLKSGSPQDRAMLSAEEYWWETGPDGRIVVWWESPRGPRAVFAEAGSDVVAE